MQDRKKSPKIGRLGTIAQLCRAISSQLRHVRYRQSEENLLNSNISPTRPHNMVNFGPLAAEIVSLVWGTPANFNGFASCLRYCSDVAHRSPEANQTLHDLWPSPDWYTVYTFLGLLLPDGIFPRAKFTLSPSLVYWQRLLLYRYGTPAAGLSQSL